MMRKLFRRANPVEPSPADRRQATRHPLDLQITCCTLGTGGGASWPATVRDISTSGIGLVFRRSFAPGTVLIVELPDAASALGRTIPVRVVHSRTAGAGQWIAGCVFATQLRAEELHDWLTSFASQETAAPAAARRGRWLLAGLGGGVLLAALCGLGLALWAKQASWNKPADGAGRDIRFEKSSPAPARR